MAFSVQIDGGILLAGPTRVFAQQCIEWAKLLHALAGKIGLKLCAKGEAGAVKAFYSWRGKPLAALCFNCANGTPAITGIIGDNCKEKFPVAEGDVWMSVFRPALAQLLRKETEEIRTLQEAVGNIDAERWATLKGSAL